MDGAELSSPLRDLLSRKGTVTRFFRGIILELPVGQSNPYAGYPNVLRRITA